MTSTTRKQVVRWRVRAHELDREPPTTAEQHAPAGCALLDLGIQNTGPDGARWALCQRGYAVTPSVQTDDEEGGGTESDDGLALVWTLRGAPHYYRRRDLPAVAVATAPFSDADAAKRIFDANRPLKAAGITALDALRVVAREMRDIVRTPTVKGEVSAQLTARLPEPYLRFCRPCDAVHVYEQPFRLAALHAGLALRPGTSPPVLERIAGWDIEPFASGVRDPRFDVIRGYLHFYGPSDPKTVAAYLDAPVRDVKAHWPADAQSVTVDGERRWMLADDIPLLLDSPETNNSVHLLGPFDPYLQLRDRGLLVPDAAHAKQLWPTLGRPGAITVDGEIVGVWRPRKAGRTLTVEVTPWTTLRGAARDGVTEQAQRLAGFRGLAAAEVRGL
ncbi:winged helix DNA-binding domain-containing protein [Rhodococcus sp. HNM0569]|uniref:winged helix DNA-binding domain-containing protein n=1 Tax=Rhodococcus sp. HNM0569 TaxID=2716340 RepID=UPI003211EDDA